MNSIYLSIFEDCRLDAYIFLSYGIGKALRRLLQECSEHNRYKKTYDRKLLDDESMLMRRLNFLSESDLSLEEKVQEKSTILLSCDREFYQSYSIGDSNEGFCVETVKPQEESDSNVISEKISFFTDFKHVCGSLQIKDTARALRVDLNDLLPNSSTFVPSIFFKAIEEHMFAQRHEDFKPVLPDLSEIMHQYKGHFVQDDRVLQSFCSMLFMVEYGNLCKKGGVLSLFHEIAHQWQTALNDIRLSHFVKYAQKSLKIFNSQAWKEEGEEVLKEHIIAKRSTCFESMFGVVFVDAVHCSEIDEFSHELLNLAKDQIFISCGEYVGLFCSFGKVQFDDILQMHVWTERNAWYGAIRSLRFLRRHVGLDVEPQLNNGLLRKYVDKCLGTYNIFIEDLLKYDRRSIKYS